MSFFSKAFKSITHAVTDVSKVATGAVKVLGSVAGPLAGVASIAIPGAGALAAGINVANKVISAANSTDPRKRAEAAKVIAATRLVAKKSKNPAERRAAINGLTVVKKQVAARKAALRHRVRPDGYVIRVA